jgi:hypothetical protein
VLACGDDLLVFTAAGAPLFSANLAGDANNASPVLGISGVIYAGDAGSNLHAFGYSAP